MTPELLHTFTLALLITSMGAIEMRNLRATSWAYLFHSIFLCAIITTYAYLFNPNLFIWSVTCFVTKIVIVPYLLFRFVKRVPNIEFRPIIGFALSIFILSIWMVITYSLLKTYAFYFIPKPFIPATVSSELMGQYFEETHRLLAASLSVFWLGIYGLLTRRDAVKTVIGLALLENGVHLVLLCLVPTLRETTLIGIVTNVIGVVWILLYISASIYEVFGTTDTVRLSELKR
ncbi:NADH-quinone oxidoreductase subunit K [candidate division KSB1 bacterium]|nr:NADH-quinone oxidoreductase subunit K [candidate division KSB1 bacterium]